MDIARVLAIQAFAVSGGVLDLGRMLFQFVGYHLMRLCVIELEGLLLFNVSCQVPREDLESTHMHGSRPHTTRCVWEPCVDHSVRHGNAKLVTLTCLWTM